MTNSLWPHGHARLSYPPLSPGVRPNSCPLSQWCYLTNCCPLLILPPVFPSLRVSSNELALRISWPKFWNFTFSISPSIEYSGLISFVLTGFIFLLSKGLSSLLQHHSSKASILFHSAFFMVHLSQSYMTTRKIIALAIHTFASKVISLLFNMVSRFIIVFFPRSKYLLISWLQALSAVIFGTQEKKICHCFCFFPFCLP